MKVVHCKSERCGKPIVWVVTDVGRKMPIDRDPVPNGHWRLDTESVAAPHASFVEPRERADYEGELYISHWATCIDADSFRIKR